MSAIHYSFLTAKILASWILESMSKYKKCHMYGSVYYISRNKIYVIITDQSKSNVNLKVKHEAKYFNRKWYQTKK